MGLSQGWSPTNCFLSKAQFHTVADHHPMLRGGFPGLLRSYYRLCTPNGSTDAFWYRTTQLEHSYQRTRRSSLKRSIISSTSAQTNLTSRIGFCLNVILMSWQLPQENTKNTGCWQYRQPERCHTFAQDRLTWINDAKSVRDGDGHLINKNK
jgi:hypothetical protein